MAVLIRQQGISGNLFAGPVSALAREKRTWSPALLAGVLWRAVSNPGALRRVYEVVKFSPLYETARKTPRFAFKYLTRDYLARGIGTGQRAACFVHHYRRLLAAIPEDSLRLALSTTLPIHEIEGYERRFTITMSLSRDFDKEGELSFFLHVDGAVVFLLGFTIVPGYVVNSEAAEAVLISRVQGMKGSFAGIHLATRMLHDVAPVAVLLAALEGFAMAFGVDEIVAVSAMRQSSFSENTAEELRQGYDDFFQSAGLTLSPDGLFKTPVPIPLKPLSQVKKGHKIRTKEKRAFKQYIQTACTDFFTSLKAGRAPDPSQFEPVVELVRK
jgi:uncharacterized protein VirK/YbjX